MDIPFLPISSFKHHRVRTGEYIPQTTFLSSGTGNQQERSKHDFADLSLYNWASMEIFGHHVTKLTDQHALFALLPSYIENGDSSLVYMVDQFMSKVGDGGYFLYNLEELKSKLEEALSAKLKIVLIGVSFALLDFATQFDIDLSGHIVMETGGMKGRGEELVKAELHGRLEESFRTNIWSEYGMTELTSQFYAAQGGVFGESQFARISIRELNDPVAVCGVGRSGQVNIIDLLNVDSCAFIQTQDIGRHVDGGFEILGRLDNADLRGCSLLYV